MRTAACLLLILFVSFLATPTIVSVINSSCDTSCFSNLAEEELSHKAVKETKTVIVNVNLFRLANLTPSIIISDNQLKHDNLSPSIFSPPPNA